MPAQKGRTAAKTAGSGRLFKDISRLIEAARERVAQTVNAGLVLLYWSIGERICKDILKGRRAGYGEGVVAALSQKLTRRYGKGFGKRNLFNMVRFAEVFPTQKIVHALSAQLGWAHFRRLLQIDDAFKRGFYAEMARIERWSTRTLDKMIQSMLYERTGISRKPAELAERELASLREEDRMSPDMVFRDPYFLDFLGLQDTYSEKDLESSILRELERFLVELGSDFAFVARQKRITLDRQDYHIDLLFYHRGMRRLVAIELKLGRFRASDKSQVELYLRWLDRHERRPSERSPIGLILCAEKSAEHVELLRLERSGIRVAQHLTALPPRRLLKRKLHDAIESAERSRMLPRRRTAHAKAADGEALDAEGWRRLQSDALDEP